MPDTLDASPAADVARADEAAGFTWDGNKLEPGIGLALSGGGFRAMLFHAGALLRLNELGLLSKVNRISSVSGGSGTLQDLPDTPRFVFCATNLQTGVLWRFSKPYAGDYLVGRIDKPSVPIARAVAASSAFPPVLSPMRLDLPAGSFKAWSSGNPTLPASDLAAFRAQVLLTDGGVYDNHGIEPIVKRYMTVFVSDGGAPFGRSGNPPIDWISQLRRVLEIADNQVRALRRRDLIDRLRHGNRAFAAGTLGPGGVDPRGRMGAYWGIDTDPDKLSLPDALPCRGEVVDRLAGVATRLSDLGERTSHGLVNWGYAICDRSVRVNYRGPVSPLPAPPQWPFPAAALGP